MPRRSSRSFDPFEDARKRFETRRTSSGRFLTLPERERALDEAFDAAVEKLRRKGGDKLVIEHLDRLRDLARKPLPLNERVRALGGEQLVTAFDRMRDQFSISEKGREAVLASLSEIKTYADQYAWEVGGEAVRVAADRIAEERRALLEFRDAVHHGFLRLRSPAVPLALRQRLSRPVFETVYTLSKHLEGLPQTQKKRTGSATKGINTDDAIIKLADLLWEHTGRPSRVEGQFPPKELQELAKRMLIIIGVRRGRRTEAEVQKGVYRPPRSGHRTPIRKPLKEDE
jgi:hypothetical protein